MSVVNQQFRNRKLAALEGLDYSKKGSIDDKILTLVNAINSHEGYATTSSCSGRIIIITQTGGVQATTVQKKHCEWLFITHDDIDDAENLVITHSCVENL